MKREFLAGLELSEEVINQIMAEHGKSVQGVQSKLDEAEEKLKAANSTLETLKKSNKDNEELQSELKSYKEKVAQMEADAKETAKRQSIKDALVAAKATDVDYLMYKLGDVEVEDLENKIKDLQTSLPSFFAQAIDTTQTEGYTFLGGADLGKGKQPEPQDVSTVIANKDVNLTQFLEQQTKGV